MSDLELTKLCAEALGYRHSLWSMFTKPLPKSQTCIPAWPNEDEPPIEFDPLHDDAQAMALVKRFGLNIWHTGPADKRWRVMCMDGPDAWGADLNRAIVECVAQLQAAKVKV